VVLEGDGRGLAELDGCVGGDELEREREWLERRSRRERRKRTIE